MFFASPFFFSLFVSLFCGSHSCRPERDILIFHHQSTKKGRQVYDPRGKKGGSRRRVQVGGLKETLKSGGLGVFSGVLHGGGGEGEDLPRTEG